MQTQKKISLDEFLDTVPQDEEDISKILESGHESAYMNADFDLFKAWYYFVNSKLQSTGLSDLDFNEYKGWSGDIEIVLNAYDQNLDVYITKTGELDNFIFHTLSFNKMKENKNSDILQQMQPLVEEILKKIQDIKNGST